jgi:hypothetical protein
VFVVARCDRFKVERDNKNNASKLDMSLVMLQELVKVVP